MDGVEPESVRVLCPDLADELVGCEAVERLQAAAKVVGRHEVIEVLPELVVVIVVEALDGGVLDGPVHAFDLSIGPGMIDFGEAVLDAVLATALVEHVDDEACGGAVGISGREAELDTIVGQHRMDLVGNGLDQSDQEL